jgi:hypothetical protein
MRLDRQGLVEEFRQFVLSGNGIIVGAPGVGKTFLLKSYCRSLMEAGVPCLFLPIDKLGANSDADLRAELGIQTDLASYLRSQDRPSSHPPTLVIDALDAARSELAQRFVLGLVRSVQEALGDRWRIIVSVRVYDAKKSLALQELFPSAGHSVGPFQDSGISCRHLSIPQLSEDEVAQVVGTIADLPPVYAAASPEFRALLRIPFNLWLVERLLERAGAQSELTSVRSEIELLNLFWHYRIQRASEAMDLNVVLTRVTSRMVAERTLAVRVADVYPLGAGATWDSLLSSEVLELVQPERQRVSFSHNILFDYAVSILLIEDDPAAACAFLANDPSRPLFLRPSVDYYFTRLWHVRPQMFWDVLWFMLRAPQTHVRVYARLVPTTVMAREARELDQFQPLLRGLAAHDDAASKAMLHLLQVVRGLFKGQRDALWSALLRQAVESLQREFAWELATLTSDVLERAQLTGQREVVVDCAHGGRRLLQWVWSERSRGASAFLDNIGGVWGVRLVCRTYALDPESSRNLLRPILEQLSNNEFPIDYFSRLTDEVPHIWSVDPDLAVEIYVAAFSHEETSDAKTGFGTPILPLTSTRRQDFSMCQYHLIRHYKLFLAANAVAAARAALRSLNEYVSRRHVVRFLNPGFTIDDVTERFAFRGRTAVYVRDLSYSWEAGHRDEPIEMADQLFGHIEAIAAAGDVASIESLLDLFAAEVRCAFFWKRLLESGSRVPSVFAGRLFELVVAEPILKNSETLQALGTFLEAATPHFDADQRVVVEQRVLALVDEVPDEKQAEWRTHRRNRLLSRLPRELLTTDDAKHLRQELEEQSGLIENRPLVRFETGWGKYSEEQWLRDEGADPSRQENKTLLEATKAVDQFSSEWRNGRPTAESVAAIVPELRTAFRAVTEITAVDDKVRAMAWTRTASAAEAVARGIEDAAVQRDAYELAKIILLSAFDADPPDDEPGLDESYTSASWSSTGATEAAQGIPWLLRARADDDLVGPLERLSRDRRPWVRFLTARELFRLVRTSPDLLWRIAEERARTELNVVAQDALCQTLGNLLPAEEHRVVPLLALLADRINVDDRDSEALKSLTGIAMWLALARQNPWAIGYADRILEHPDQFSHGLSYAVFDAVQYVAPNTIETERAEWSTRAVAWLSRALDAAARGLNAVRDRAGGTWDDAATERAKRLYGVLHEVVMRLHFAFDSEFDSSRRGGGTPSESQRIGFYRQVKPLLEQILTLAREPDNGMMFASTAHHFMEFLQQALTYDPRGVLHLAAQITLAAEGGGYHLDSMAASETVKLADRILTDYRSELRDEAAMADMVQLLDMFAKVGWPDALALLWRLDEVFR